MITNVKLPDTFFAAFEDNFEVGDQFINIALMHAGDLPIVGQPLGNEYFYFRVICSQTIRTGAIEWSQENGPLTYKEAAKILAALWNGEDLAVVQN